MNIVLKTLAAAMLEKSLDGKSEGEVLKILDTMFTAQIKDTPESLGYVPSLLIKPM